MSFSLVYSYLNSEILVLILVDAPGYHLQFFCPLKI
jgi:hypothetical protein